MHILIADPDSSSRRAFRLLLKRRLAVCEIFEADDMEALIQLLTDAPFDLLLLDWKLYRSSAPEISVRPHKVYPGMQVILLSLNPDHLADATVVGAEFVHKGASPDHLLTVLENLFPNKFAG